MCIYSFISLKCFVFTTLCSVTVGEMILADQVWPHILNKHSQLHTEAKSGRNYINEIVI